MAEDNSNEDRPQIQRPSRAVQHTAPGVFGARQLPAGEVAASLATGDVVSGRFEILRYLGASGGGISYLSRDNSTEEEAVIKVLAMPAPPKEQFERMYELVRVASSIEHKNLTRIIGMGRTPTGDAFVALEFVRGSTLSAIISQRREEGGSLSLRDAFTVCAHVCNALDEVHAKTTHCVLTPYNVYIDRRGVVRVGNLAFGRIAADFLFTKGEGPYVDSIYVAPEVAETPDLINSGADIYSLGMLAAEMLSPRGLPADRDDAKVLIAQTLASHPPALMELIMGSIGEDLAARPRDASDFKNRFEKICDQVGVRLTGPPPPGGLPLEPAIQDDNTESDIFDIPELAGVGGEPSDASNERYLVQKGGLDYGPFTAELVLEQLYADEIDEYTQVLDRVTQERIPLGEMNRFKKEVSDYIPIREERKRREAEARAELERKVKKGGVAGLVVGIFVGLAILISTLVAYLLQPDPEALPMDRAFASLDYKFQPPPKDFQSVAVDSDLLSSIFNPKASEEEIAKAIKKRRGGKKRGSSNKKRPNKANGGGDENVSEIDLMASGGSTHILTDEEVNDVILSNFGGLRSCILKELKRDSRFRGVTIRFFIRPSGTTGGVKVNEKKYSGEPVADCLTSRFRSMKFPEHGGLNRGVTYPLRVQ